MTFHVEPEFLKQYARELDQQNEATEAGRSYATKWGTLSAHQKGILGMLHGKHEGFMQELDEVLQKVSRIMDTSSSNLSASARQYERTDDNAAAKLDASYPAAERPIISAGS
jgi:uncharacterized protein YukE